MSQPTRSVTSRRKFLQDTGRIAAASALVAGTIPRVHAAEDNTIKVVLVGCGGRGTGAAANALAVKTGPIKLVAMADVFEKRLADSHKNLKNKFGDQVDVPDDRKFVGFDGYQKAMEFLKPGDVAIFATPPAFRWVHFAHAIQKGLNVFMEKPVTVDGPTTRKMLKLAAEADKKNLKVGVGLMVRHCRGRQELRERLCSGELGDIIALRAYRMGPGGGTTKPNKDNLSEVLWQIRHFHAFLWASGGVFSDYYIHQIDECSWMRGAWPVEAQALGGRHYRGDSLDQNFDTYSVEFTYPDGTKLFYYGRNMPGVLISFASFAHCSKGAAVISTRGHSPGRVRTYKGHNMKDEELVWAYRGYPKQSPPEDSPYQLEWEDLTEAIRQDKPYNEAKRGAEASLVASMGRMAAHTGQVVTFDEILNCEHEFAPDVDKLTMDGPAPLHAGPDGMYPVPQPGMNKKREY